MKTGKVLILLAAILSSSIFLSGCLQTPEKTPENNPALAEFEKLAEKSPSAKVTYEGTYVFAGNEPKPVQVITYTIGNILRYDLIEGEQTTRVWIKTAITAVPSEKILCIQNCLGYKSDSLKEGIIDLKFIKQQAGTYAANKRQYPIEKSPSKTILGQQATCFSVGENPSAEYCFSQDGIILYAKNPHEPSAVDEMTATSIERTFDSAVLDFPENINWQS